MRFGILTGGGDAPGLNGIIESVSRYLLASGHEVIGLHDGFDGVFKKDFVSLGECDLHRLHAKAGTRVGTSNRSRIEGREDEFVKSFQEMGLEALIVAGGDGTFAALSHIEDRVPIIAVPKTIDNDLQGTEITFGFDTACSVISGAVDALHASAEAHRRVMIVECMGRTAGWIALGGGVASVADAILIPERPFSKKKLAEFIKQKKSSGRRGMVFVVSESAHPEGEEPLVARRVKEAVQQERFGGIAENLARWIEAECDWEARHVVPGHLQRAHAPSTTDRFLSLSMGMLAAELAHAGRYQQAVVYRNGRVQAVSLSEIMGPARQVPAGHRWVDLAEKLGIFI